jgi:hypothetical protein
MAELPIVRRVKSIEDVRPSDRGLSSRDHDGFLFHEMKYLRRKYKGVYDEIAGTVLGIRSLQEPCASKVSHHTFNLTIICSEWTQVAIRIRGMHDNGRSNILGIDTDMHTVCLQPGVNMIFGDHDIDIRARGQVDNDEDRYFKTHELCLVDSDLTWIVKDLNDTKYSESVRGTCYQWFNGWNHGDRVDAISGVIVTQRKNTPLTLLALARIQLIKNDLIEGHQADFAYGLPLDGTVPEHSILKLKSHWYEFFSSKLYRMSWRSYLWVKEQLGEEVYVSDDSSD